RADPNKAGPVAKTGEVGGAEVAHAGLNPADQLGEDGVDGAGDFLERFDPFGGHFSRGVELFVSVPGGRAHLHGGETSHAAVLFVKLAVDLDNFTGRFATAGEEAAADNRIGKRQRLDDIAALRDAAVGDNGDSLVLGDARRGVDSGQLGNPDPGDQAGGANR